MSLETLKPSQLLPGYASWYNFIYEQAGLKAITPQKSGEVWILNHLSQRNVANTVYFTNKTLRGEPAILAPTSLIQEYVNRDQRYSIEVSCNDKCLSNQFDITPLADPFIHHLAVENESIFSGSRWEKSQKIFLLLDNDYLAQLKKRSILPNNAKDRIRIHKVDQETNITIMLEGEKEVEKKEILPEETLRTICQETGFNYNFNPMEQVTEGNIGNIYFRLDQPQFTALDPAKVWDSLTSKNPKELFIFPVRVWKK